MKRLLFPIIFALFCLTFFSFENLRSEGFKAAPLNSEAHQVASQVLLESKTAQVVIMELPRMAQTKISLL